MLPNLLIPGPGQAGTSYLAFTVSQHPDIHMIPEKEVHFFDQFDPDTPIARILARLTKYEFRVSDGYAGQHYLLDGSPSYFHDGCGPEKMAEVIGANAICLILLRNPADRAYSHYVHDVVNFLTTEPFLPESAEEQPWIQQSCCANKLERFLASFPNRVKIILFDDLAHAPQDVLNGVFDYLGLDPFDVDTSIGKNPRAGIPLRVGTLDEAVEQEDIGPVDQIDVSRGIFLKFRERQQFVFDASAHSRAHIAAVRERFTEVLSDTEKRAANKKYFAEDIARLEGITGRTFGWMA